MNDGTHGKLYWRSLDDLAGKPEFQRWVRDEFPGMAEELSAPSTRRGFLKIMAASLGLAGFTACRWPKEEIHPFANRPDGRVPGVPQQFATAFELGGAALGLLVTSYDGRPIKIEGNPLHPASLGAANAFAQASVLELYDPDRSQNPVRREKGQELSARWDDFVAFAGPHFDGLRAKGGAGFAVLSEETSSPSLARLRERFRTVFPRASWHEYEPISRDAEREGTRLLFGRALRPLLHLDRADVIVCLDDDPIYQHPNALRHARDFASLRRAENGAMNRLYVAESVLSLTGAAADHRVAVSSRKIASLVVQLSAELSRLGVRLPGAPSELDRALAQPGQLLEASFVATAARDLAASRGRALVLVGPRQPAPVHALCHALNLALDGAVTYVEDSGAAGRPGHFESLAALVAEMKGGGVGTLLILGGNPVYDAPADLGFPGALGGVQTPIHLGLYDDETSRRCRWHVHRAHYLESWGDVRAWDGTVSVQQPLIEALYGGKSAIELLALAVGEPAAGYDIVRATHAGLASGSDAEAAWKRTLNDGVLAGSAAPAPAKPVEARPSLELMPELLAALSRASGNELEIVFTPDASAWDGRFANNAWLQELPDPLTRVTWDNPVTLSPATADALGVRHGDLVSLSLEGRSVEAAVYVLPGQAAGSLAFPLGYGRKSAGRVGNGAGFNAYALRTSSHPYVSSPVAVTKTGRTYPLACTQDHQAIDTIGLQERGKRVGQLVREGTLARFLAEPDFPRKMGEELPSLALYSEQKYKGEHQWGMSIDLSACIGCNVCAVACQAENNIPVVGKVQVGNGREMHWIRVDRYFTGGPEAPRAVFQPVTCQHCENAPCEEVCPVAATSHSQEGLNQMVYNRCVGTRYCSNNCPYKVRRFNFFNYFPDVPEVTKMVYNPEVTVRSRGVMEKCTFCVQRIEAVKIAARNARRPILDGEITPACVQTCPTQAIVFGDLKDPDSRVAKLHREERSYALLGELNVKPRNRYLARLRNPSNGTGRPA